ncbi:hypothetical protein [Paraburkholderia sp. SIMBA_030]|uniref:hypothetical protein n=1 Tax=Paraburkholderia sp. SIMBA_030 TaxID=3085773 RepID=UPI00397CEAC2
MGATILNSLESETSIAEAIEYRRGLTNHLDATIGYLHGGEGHNLRRNGVTAQVWLTRGFFDELYTPVEHALVRPGQATTRQVWRRDD